MVFDVPGDTTGVPVATTTVTGSSPAIPSTVDLPVVTRYMTCQVSKVDFELVLKSLRPRLSDVEIKRLLQPPPTASPDSYMCEQLTDMLMRPITPAFFLGSTAAATTTVLATPSATPATATALPSIGSGSDSKTLRGEVIRVLGAGGNGVVVLCQLENNGQVALKTGEIAPDEFKLQQVFAEHGLAPRPIAERSSQYSRQMSMETVDGTLNAWWADESRTAADAEPLVIAVLNLLTQLQQANLTHGDMHVNNIVYRIEKNPTTGRAQSRLFLIDFARSSTKGSFLLLEILQLFRTALLAWHRFGVAQSQRLAEVRAAREDPRMDWAFAAMLVKEERARDRQHKAIFRSILKAWKQTFWGIMWNTYPLTMAKLFGSISQLRLASTKVLREQLTKGMQELTRVRMRRERGAIGLEVDLNHDYTLAHLVKRV